MVISKDVFVRFPEGSATVIRTVTYGALRVRHELELTPTDSFHFMSMSCGNKGVESNCRHENKDTQIRIFIYCHAHTMSNQTQRATILTWPTFSVSTISGLHKSVPYQAEFMDKKRLDNCATQGVKEHNLFKCFGLKCAQSFILETEKGKEKIKRHRDIVGKAMCIIPELLLTCLKLQFSCILAKYNPESSKNSSIKV